jgi:hypothetical protein
MTLSKSLNFNDNNKSDTHHRGTEHTSLAAGWAAHGGARLQHCGQRGRLTANEDQPSTLQQCSRYIAGQEALQNPSARARPTRAATRQTDGSSAPEHQGAHQNPAHLSTRRERGLQLRSTPTLHTFPYPQAYPQKCMKCFSRK